MSTCIGKLKKGKATGKDGISGEHILYASEKVSFFLSCLFNMMMIHSFLPTLFMDTFLINLIKDKKGSLTDKDNYRPIAITTVMSKLLENCLFEKYSEFFATNSHQFGFKKGHSTDFSIFVFKETIDYFNCFSSPVYVCYLDASKAFDRLNYWVLFRKLLDRKTPILVVKLLTAWYTSQRFSVLWDGIMSDGFNVANGVRQGGVLSPHLFGVYMEELSCRLQNLDIGCFINDTCLNHIFYADDAVLLAPTVESLQRLLNVCDAYADDFSVIYNSKKSCCTAFLPSNLKNISIPSIYLKQRKLEWIQSKEYLGVILCSDRSDDLDIQRQIKAIYKQGNALIRKFYMCTDNIKVKLFKSFCYNMYGSSLWSNFSPDVLNDASIAFNNVFRQLFNLNRRCSMSFEFYSRKVVDFYTLLKKAILCLYKRLQRSTNTLVNAIFSSSFFTYESKLYSHWMDLF